MRWLPSVALAAYAPHLLEEHVSGMADEPWIRLVFEPLEQMPTPAAAYLVFQATFVLMLAMTALYALGGRARALVLFVLGLALLAESHHVVRALFTFEWNPGLLTAAPMPIVGFVLVRAVLADRAAGLGGPGRSSPPAARLRRTGLSGQPRPAGDPTSSPSGER